MSLREPSSAGTRKVYRKERNSNIILVISSALIREHLTNVSHRFQLYFPAEEDPRKGNGWIALEALS